MVADFMLIGCAWYDDAVIDKKLSAYFAQMGRKSAKARSIWFSFACR
jgi:hypothetical protein